MEYGRSGAVRLRSRSPGATYNGILRSFHGRGESAISAPGNSSLKILPRSLAKVQQVHVVTGTRDRHASMHPQGLLAQGYYPQLERYWYIHPLQLSPFRHG
jgi:hypothetical protein